MANYYSLLTTVIFFTTAVFIFSLTIFILKKLFCKKLSIGEENLKVINLNHVGNATNASNNPISQEAEKVKCKSMFILLALFLHVNILLSLSLLCLNIVALIDATTYDQYIIFIAYTLLNLLYIYSCLMLLRWKKIGFFLYSLCFVVGIVIRLIYHAEPYSIIGTYIVFIILILMPWKKKNFWTQLE